MYTQHGLQQRKNLENIANIGENMLAALRPIVEKVPGIVIKRVKDTGSGAKGKFSAYNPDYAKKKGKRSHKDFYLTGTMWGSFVIVKEEVTASGLTFTLGTTDGKGSNGQFLSDIHSETRTKHPKGGTQGESQLILDITDEEWEKIENALFRKFAENIKL